MNCFMYLCLWTNFPKALREGLISKITKEYSYNVDVSFHLLIENICFN